MRFRFQIGTKLALSAAIGIALVGGMLTNNLLSNASVTKSSSRALNSRENVERIQAAQITILRARHAAQTILLSETAAEIDRTLDALARAENEGQASLDDAVAHMFKADQRQRGSELKGLLTEYSSATRDMAKAQKTALQSKAARVASEERQRLDRQQQQMEGIANEILATASERGRESHAQAEAEMAQATRLDGAVGVLVMVSMIGTAIFGALTIARPIRRIGDVLRALSEGNRTIEIPYGERQDEVGDTARAAETFRQNLLRIEKMEAEQQKIERDAQATRRAEMQRLANEFEAAIGEIVQTVSSASAELEAASATLTSSAESTDQLAGSVTAASHNTASNVQSVASAAEEMTSSIREIARNVQESSQIAGEAVAQAQKTDTRIAELSQAASRIGDVVKLITAIAEQTNLLALNATIEAARAGDAGRGFAVVAQEVKALAAQTAKATEEIGSQIAGMQNATQESVGAIKEIGATIARVSSIAATIAVAVEEQGAAIQEISRSVHQAADGASGVARDIATVKEGASETGAASNQVHSSAQSLAQESSRLKIAVDRFLTTIRRGPEAEAAAAA
jgi:methyl-accepting chemotaxis protein